MSHSHGRQETRNDRWQQRQRDESREANRNRMERNPQGEHSGQRNDHYLRDRWESDPGQNYAYPRESNSDASNYSEYDSRYDPRSRPESWRNPQGEAESNREWVSGTGQPPYWENRTGRYGSKHDVYAGSPMSYEESQPPDSNFNGRPRNENRQSFAGRGPQGYKRSDERITEDINEAMTRDHDLDATNISVETTSGEVVLKGTVSDRASKRRAEEIAEACSGVHDVQNQIRIKRDEGPVSGSESRDEKSNSGKSTKLAS